MSTTAGELLGIMRVRLGMQEDGTTNPPETVKNATKSLVESLVRYDKKDEIEIDSGSPARVRYYHKASNVLLAEISGDEST